MRRIILLMFLFFQQVYAHQVYSQAKIVFNDSVYVVIENAAKVIVENSAADAILSTGEGGFVTESEFDQVYWLVGSSTGLYVLPFIAQPGLNTIPFSFDITTGGAGSGFIKYSTFGSTLWDNGMYMPSDVYESVQEIPDHMIDRFWIIDATGYDAKPAGKFTFKYVDSEHAQIENSISEENLIAQRFNSTQGVWDDFLPFGNVDVTTNEVNADSVSPNDFFRTWSLRSNVDLSVDLNDYSESTWAYSDVGSGQLIIGMVSTRMESVDLQLIDASGKLIAQKVLSINQGSNILTIPDLFLSSGIYYLVLKSANRIESLKILVK